jgi:predicted phage-related endonuclease
MLTSEQLSMRKTGLTATDIVTLCDPPPFKEARTEHDLFIEKTMDVPPRESTEAMELGHELEPVIIRRVAKKLGLAVAYPATTIRHPDYPLFMATPDAHVVDAPDLAGTVMDESVKYERIGLVEAKAVGVGAMSHWEEDDEVVPDYVYLQCVVQMWVRKLPFVIVAALMGTRFVTHRIEWGPGEDELAEAIRERGERWWRDHVVARKPPEIDQSEGASRMVRALVGKKHNGAIIQAGPEAEHAARMYAEATAQIKEAEARKREASTRLIEIIADNDGVQGNGWRAKHTMRKGYEVAAYEVKEGRTFDLRRSKEPKGSPG